MKDATASRQDALLDLGTVESTPAAGSTFTLTLPAVVRVASAAVGGH